jgi:hypothetical protein
MTMRLRVSGLVIAALVWMAGSTWADTIRVEVNGQQVHFPYAQPTEINGRVMIPLRGVLERLGADRVDWRPISQEMIVAGPDQDMRLRIGDQAAIVNGQRVPLDVPPMIVRGTTMVPLRFVSENLGANVDWVDSTQTVYIATPNERVAGSREQYPAPNREQRGQGTSREPRPQSGYVTALLPHPGSRAADSRSEIFARFRAGAPIDFSTVRLYVNGQDVTSDAEITSEGVRYRPSDDLPRGRNDVRLSLRDTSGVRITRVWYFFAP